MTLGMEIDYGCKLPYLNVLHMLAESAAAAFPPELVRLELAREDSFFGAEELREFTLREVEHHRCQRTRRKRRQ